MSKDRLLNIISFILSSVLIFVVLDSFSAVILLVLDLLWLFYWLSLSDSKSNIKLDVKIRTLLLATVLLLGVGFYLNSIGQVSMSSLSTQDLLALFPLILLIQLGFKGGESA